MANDTLRDNVRRDLQDSTRIPFSFKKFVQGIGEAVSNASRNAYDRITDVPDELRNGFSKVSSTIQSSTTEIMGSALNSMLNDIKSLASGVKDIAVGTFSKLFSFFGSDVEEDQLDQEKKQTKTLGNIFKIFKD
jgi:phage-related protein